MTDLLGLLASIHGAVQQLGGISIELTPLPAGANWLVDRHTCTIHVRPGLSMPDGLRAMTEALAVLAPPVVEAPPVAVGGDVAAGVSMPGGRHLRALPKR